jgi:hypothetical protein
VEKKNCEEKEKKRMAFEMKQKSPKKSENEFDLVAEKKSISINKRIKCDDARTADVFFSFLLFSLPFLSVFPLLFSWLNEEDRKNGR